MHIGIDAHAIGARQGGNETYIRNLIEALAEIDGENQYTLYFSSSRAAEEWNGRFHNFRVKLLPPPAPLVRVPIALTFELRRRPVDVLHVQYTSPPICNVPVVATIHDLAFEHLPETFTRRGRAQLRMTVRRTARHAARIATVSEFSRNDLIETYGIAPEKIVVTANGVGTDFGPNSGEDESAKIRKRYNISRDYILAVGSLQPRKNLVRLLQAYDRLREVLPSGPQLVIVGRRLWLASEIFSEIRKRVWGRDVICTGFVPPEDLPALYRSSTALVYPSLFEGFGLPPLEAMACGTPVLTSSTSSLPEVVGDAGLLVNPYEVSEIASALYTIVSDQVLRSTLRLRGLERAKQFTWRLTAQKTLELYRASCQSGAL